MEKRKEMEVEMKEKEKEEENLGVNSVKENGEMQGRKVKTWEE